jgi:anti-sigma-K factor RskA
MTPRMSDTAPHTPDQPTSAPFFQRVSTWWRALAIFLALVVLLGWAAGTSMLFQLREQIQHLQTRLADVPQVRDIAVLLDDQQRPAMLITVTPQQGSMLIQRLNEVKEGREDSMQIWALQAGAEPRSLGVITSKYKTLEMPIAPDALQGVDELGISAENKGGVPASAGPSLPWLFKGWLVRKAL